MRIRDASLVASRACPFRLPRCPPPSLPAGALAWLRVRAGVEHAAGCVPWLGLPHGNCLLHALCMEKNGQTLQLCWCWFMHMLMLVCLSAAVAGLGVCVLARARGVGGAVCVRARAIVRTKERGTHL